MPSVDHRPRLFVGSGFIERRNARIDNVGRSGDVSVEPVWHDRRRGVPLAVGVRTHLGTDGVAPLAVDPLAPDIWSSFCLEYNEEIEFGRDYLATVDVAARNGGRGGAVGGVDPLDARTAFLYTAFADGTLAGYQYAPVSTGLSRANTANALQFAIWWIEDEWALNKTGSLTAAEATLARAFYQAADSAVSSGAWSGLGDVRVMHLTTLDGGTAQDQVVRVGPASVPLPPAAFAGLALLAGHAIRRRVAGCG